MSCPDCFKGAIHNKGTPAGTMESLHGYQTYVTLPPDGVKSASTILFLTDAFGLALPNNKLLADQYAAQTGFRVIMPDIIPGGAAPVWVLDSIEFLYTPAKSWFDIVTLSKKFFKAIFMVGRMVPFMIKAAPPKAYPAVLEYTRKVRADLPAGAKLGAAGFCWGGYHSTKLAAEPLDGADGKKSIIDVQYCAHPSAITPQDVIDGVTKLGTPYSLAIGDKDQVFKKAQVEEAEAVLREKVGAPEGHDYQITMYDGGVLHGFAVRSAESDKLASAAAYDAAQQAVEWFKKYL